MRTSLEILALLALAIGLLVIVSARHPTPDAASYSPQTATIIPDLPFQHLRIAKTTWRKGGFDAVAFATFQMKNYGTESVINPVISCSFFGKSGTAINSHDVTVYEVFPAGKTKSTDELSLGFIDQQVSSASCEVTGAD